MAFEQSGRTEDVGEVGGQDLNEGHVDGCAAVGQDGLGVLEAGEIGRICDGSDRHAGRLRREGEDLTSARHLTSSHQLKVRIVTVRHNMFTCHFAQCSDDNEVLRFRIKK